MAKRTQIMASMYAPRNLDDNKWRPIQEALKALGIDWDGDWEIVDCPDCGSSQDCDCKEEG